MRFAFQLIQNYLTQDIPCIVVTSETAKYYFNVPPSFQRFIRFHRQRLPVKGFFFFTKVNSTTIAGLSGLMMTLFEKPEINCKLYLQKSLYDYFQDLKWKIGHKILAYSYSDWQGRYQLGLLDKQALQKYGYTTSIYALLKDSNPQFSKYPVSKINNAQEFVTKTPSFKNEELQIIPFSVVSKGEELTNYILMLPKAVGGFNTAKLKQLKIAGLKMQELIKNGKIQVGQRIVYIQEVKEPNHPSPNLLILHFNSEDSIQKVLQHPTFKKYIQNKANFTNTVIHIAETKEIVTSQLFRQMISVFPPVTEHVLYNREFKNKIDKKYDFFTFPAHVDQVTQLSKLFPKHIPNIHDIHAQFTQKYFAQCQILQERFPNAKIHAYKRLYQNVLIPSKGKGYQPIIDQFQKNKIDKILQVEGLDINELKATINKCNAQNKVKFQTFNPKILFLGTGSMMPSKHRNVSSIFVQLNENNSILLDCGEGSHYQLYNHFGPGKIDEILLSIRIIFITHIHADHNLGILDLIAQRMKTARKYGRKDKIYLIIPSNMMTWLNGYMKNVENLREGMDIVFIQTISHQKIIAEQGNMSKDERKGESLQKEKENQEQQIKKQIKQEVKQFKQQFGLNDILMNECPAKKSEMIDQSQENQDQYQKIFKNDDQTPYYFPNEQQILDKENETQQKTFNELSQYLKSVGINTFQPIRVIHCPQSYGIVINHQSGVKISYSGDSRPTTAFKIAAKDSTIMIHEATFGDDLKDQAVFKKHSTVGQAIDMGMQSNSWKTALTHFSQRYRSASDIVNPSLYKTDKSKHEYSLNHTITCFDHMEMHMSDLHVMPYFSRAIASIVPKQINE